MTNSNKTLDLDPAARQLKTVLAAISDDQLSARTPCEDASVGDLLDHFMSSTIAFRHGALKTGAGTGPPPAASATNLPPDWRQRLPEQLDELVAAWRDPAAWTGTTETGGTTMPAEAMGVVALDEMVIHGWDLARATGQPFSCDPASTEAIFGLLSGAVDRGKGMFGPVVEVPSDAPLLDRAIGLSGRDPSWTP